MTKKSSYVRENINNPLVSVVILNFNGKYFVSECIDSVLSSEYLNIEVIVIDNASTDESYEYLNKKYQKNRKVKVIQSKTQLYFTGGNNLGAEKANGQLLFFLNNDTVVDKKCIKSLVGNVKNQSKCLVQPKILMYSNKKIIDNAGGRFNFFGFGISRGRGKIDQKKYNLPSTVDYVSGTAFMINRNFFFSLKGFDTRMKYYYEDVDLSLRAKRNNAELWYFPKAVIYHKGSLTFKKNVDDFKLRWIIRRNRILTLLKNENILFLPLKLASQIIIIVFLLLFNPIFHLFKKRTIFKFKI